MPEAVQIFIAPPDPEALRERLEARGTDSAEAIERRLRTAEVELEAQGEFPHVVVNDDVQRAAVASWSGLVRDELVPTLTPMSMIQPESTSFSSTPIPTTPPSLVAAKRARQINAYYHSLSEGAYGEYTPPMVEIPQRELPHHRPGGDGSGQAQVRVQVLVALGGLDGPHPARSERRHRRLQVA